MNLNTAFQMVLANPPPASTTAITIDVLAWDKAQAMLAQMSPTNSDKIRKVGLALHNHYEGSAEVKDAYLCWVKTGDAYSEGEACALWDKADVNDPNAITISTFIELAELDGIHQLSPAQERFAALTKCPLVSFIAFPEMTQGPPPSPVKKSQVNIEAFLDAFGIGFAYDEFNKIVQVVGLKGVERLDDSVINRLHLGADAYGLQVPETYFFNVVRALGDYNTQHPVRTYLSGLVWDGVKRLDSWIVQATGCEDTDYTRAVGKVFIVAAVRRIMRPGCKFDLIPILEGHQGGGKSTLFKSLVPNEEWFSDNLEIGSEPKEVIEQTKGKWILELPELSGMGKRDVEHMKAFASRAMDAARMAYERITSEVARQFVCAGTTNSTKYLKDTTGNRRFAPIACPKDQPLNIEWVVENRDQLWAEAVEGEKTYGPLHIPKELWEEAGKQAELRRDVDPAEEFLNDAVSGDELIGFVRTETLRELLKNADYQRAMNDNAMIRRVMEKNGWIDVGQQRFHQSKTRCWRKGDVKAGEMIKCGSNYDGSPRYGHAWLYFVIPSGVSLQYQYGEFGDGSAERQALLSRLRSCLTPQKNRRDKNIRQKKHS